MAVSAALSVIIPAAGSGSRMANASKQGAKQYLPLAGKPVLQYSLDLFCLHPHVSQVYLVLSPEDHTWQTQFAHQLEYPNLNVLYCGGATRAASVQNALQQIPAQAQDWIAVHDAARPGLTLQLFNQLLHHLEQHPVGGLLALPISDTVKLADAQQQVIATQARDGLWIAQTPQMFRYQILCQALAQVQSAPTDEAQAVEALGLQPQLVLGSAANMKITYQQDLLLVQAMMQAREMEA